eukprot:gene6890-3284_t
MPFSEGTHISIIEMWILANGVRLTRPPSHIAAYSDNATVVTRATLGSHQPLFQQMARDFAIWLVEHGVELVWLEWVWTKENVFADALSRSQPGADDVQISQKCFDCWVADTCGSDWPAPTLDALANPYTAKLPRFISRCAWDESLGCVGRNFFEFSWYPKCGEVLWCFPPPRLAQRPAEHVRTAAACPVFFVGPRWPCVNWLNVLRADARRLRVWPLQLEDIEMSPEGVSAVRNPHGPGRFRDW